MTSYRQFDRLFRLPVILVLFLVIAGGQVLAVSPDSELWSTFMNRPLPDPVVPEDPEMGLLANLRRPEAAWAGAIAVCEGAFASLEDGTPPAGNLSADLELPMTRAFEAALGDSGRFQAGRRYGRPLRRGDRLTVPLRLAAGDQVVYGDIYLVRIDGGWFIEQWALDLSGFIVSGE